MSIKESAESNSLRAIASAKVNLHLSEVKGPVMDQLKRTHFLLELSGQVFLSQFDAFKSLEPKLAEKTLNFNKIS